tara:strand:- start:849 stop:1067 length:219 start_codon:yes stop_codon:yes gene_type:complete
LHSDQNETNNTFYHLLLSELFALPFDATRHSRFEIKKGPIKSEAALCSPLISNAIDSASKGKTMNHQRIMND